MIHYFQQMVVEKKIQRNWVSNYNKESKSIKKKISTNRFQRSLKLFEKYIGKYLYDLGEREEILKQVHTRKMVKKLKNYNSLKYIKVKRTHKLGDNSCHSYN